MSDDYSELVDELLLATFGLAAVLRQKEFRHPDLEEEADRLRDVFDALGQIRESGASEAAGRGGVLATSAALAGEVTDRLADYASDVRLWHWISDVSAVCIRIREAGFIASIEHDLSPADHSNDTTSSAAGLGADWARC
jgi:hypothetical protein